MSPQFLGFKSSTCTYIHVSLPAPIHFESFFRFCDRFQMASTMRPKTSGQIHLLHCSWTPRRRRRKRRRTGQAFVLSTVPLVVLCRLLHVQYQICKKNVQLYIYIYICTMRGIIVRMQANGNLNHHRPPLRRSTRWRRRRVSLPRQTVQDLVT